jgi:CHAT domain-containing protein
MSFLQSHFLNRYPSALSPILALMWMASVLLLGPQDAASEPISPQLEQARSLAEKSPEQALSLATLVAESSKQKRDTQNETFARALIVDIVRANANLVDVPLYREQLDRLETLGPEDELNRTKHYALLSVLRAELALYLADNVEAVKLARVAITKSESSQEKEIVRIAKVALGVALARGILMGFLEEAKIYKKAYGMIDPQAYKEPLTLLNQGLDGKPLEGYPFLVIEGKQNLAFIYSIRNEHEKALVLYREVEPRISAPPFVRAQHLINVASAELALKHQQEAEEHLQVAWELLHTKASEADEKGRAKALLGSTGSFLAAGQLEKVESAFRESTDILSKEPDGRQVILTNLDRYIVPDLEARDESNIGAQILEKTLSIPGIGDDPSIALPLLAKLGRFYTRLLDYQKFAEVNKRASSLHAKSPDWKAVQDLLIYEATIRTYEDPSGTALAYRQAILAGLNQNDGKLFTQLLFYGLRQATHLAMIVGRYQDALDFSLIGLTYLKTTREEDPFDTTMEFLIETSRAMTKLGRFDLTEDALSLAIGLLPKVQPDWEQRIRIAASEFYSLIGDTEMSLYNLNLVKQLSMAEHIAQSAPVLMRQRAGVLKVLGNYLMAEDALRACVSMSIGPAIRRPDAEMWCRWDLSRLLWEDLAEYKEGGEEYLKALKLSIDQKDRFAFVEMKNFMNIRGLLQGYEDPAEAIKQSRQTIETLKGLPSTVPVDTYRVLCQLIVLFAQNKMGDKQLEWIQFDELLNKLMAEPYISTREYEYLMIIGRTLKAMAENARALSVLEGVVKRIEYVRSLLIDPRLQIRLGADVNELYDEIVAMYLDEPNRKGTIKALQTAEGNRGRSIRHFEKMGQKSGDTGKSQGTIQEQARAELERLRKHNGNARTDEETKAATTLLTLKLRIEDVIPVSHELPHIPIKVLQSQPMRSIDIDKFQSALSPAVAVIMYHLTGGHAGAWVITKESLQWMDLGDSENVKAQILHYRTALLSEESGSDARLKTTATEAFDVLLGPLSSAIEGKTHLVIIPDASAFLIPFEALVISKGPDTGKYVIERYSVSYHMSLGHLAQSTDTPIHPAGSERTVLLVGNPTFPQQVFSATAQERIELVPLAGAQREIERIRDVLGTINVTVYMGDDARKERFQEQLRHTTVAHFATHGVLNERYPWASYIALAGENGNLLLDELPRTPITADLVVLSACETGRGRILAGEGVWGFQSQFLAAGAKNVVGTLWRVEDDSTAGFMEEFYREIGPKLTGYAHALQLAKLKLLHSDKWHHPYYWAPFVLYGQAVASR